MKALYLFLLLAFASCTKDQVELRRPMVEVRARMCALEMTDGDRVIRDTIIGLMVYEGGVTADTMPGTARYNFALREGEGLAVRVTHLRAPAYDGEACVNVFGDEPTGSVCSGDSIVVFSL